MRTSGGGMIDVEMLNSNLHVFTRLKGRDGVTNADYARQHKTFTEMEKIMKSAN